MNTKKIFIGVIGLVLIAAVVYAIYYFTQDEQGGGLGTNINSQYQEQNQITETDAQPLIDMYYDDMMDTIMTPVGVGQGTYKTYPLTGWFETLSPSFYTGYPAEFENVVNKRIQGLIEMNNPAYKINGVVTPVGALLDVYAAVGGSIYLTECINIFNEFKPKYLDAIGN